MRLDTGRLDTGHLDTVRLDTGRLDTGHLDTGHLDTLHLDTVHLDTVRYIVLGTVLLGTREESGRGSEKHTRSVQEDRKHWGIELQDVQLARSDLSSVQPQHSPPADSGASPASGLFFVGS